MRYVYISTFTNCPLEGAQSMNRLEDLKPNASVSGIISDDASRTRTGERRVISKRMLLAIAQVPR